MDSQYPNVLRTGARNTLRAEGAGAGIPPKPPAPRMGPVSNPNVAPGLASAEGLAQSQRLSTQAAPGIGPQRPLGMPPTAPAAAAAPPVAPPVAAPGTTPAARPSLRQSMLGSGDQWRDMLKPNPNSPHATGRLTAAPAGSPALGKLAGRGMGVLGLASAGKEIYDGVQEGDAGKVGWGSADAAATAGLASPLAPAAGVYLAGRSGWEAGKALGDSLSEDTKDTIGGSINTFMNRFGLGVDDSNYLRQKGQARQAAAAAAAPKPAAPAAAPSAAAPAAPPAPPRLAVDQRNDDWTNTEVAKRNPSGQVNVSVGPDGVPTFSGNNVNGAVSYKDDRGAIPGKGWVGDGWGGGMNVISMPKGDTLRGEPAPQGGAIHIQGDSINMGAAAKAGMTGPVGGMTALEMSKLPPQTRHELRVQAARDAAEMERTQVRDQTQRYSADSSAASNRYNTNTNAETLRRGQDMELEGRLLPKQWDLAMQQQQRARAAAYFRQAGGDYAQAAKLAAADGFGDLATSFQGSAGANSKYAEEQLAGVRGLFKNQFDTTGSDGKVVSRPDLEAAATEQVMKMTGGNFLSLPPEQRNALMSKAINDVKALGDANQLRGGTLERLGWDPMPPAYSQLPSAAEDAGSTLRQASMVERLSPFSPLKNGDWVQTTGDGREFRFRGDTLDQSQINERLRNGAKLK